MIKCRKCDNLIPYSKQIEYNTTLCNVCRYNKLLKTVKRNLKNYGLKHGNKNIDNSKYIIDIITITKKDTKPKIKEVPNIVKEHRKIRDLHKKLNLKKDCCEKCGSTENLHLHHNTYTIKPNVTTLCKKCHFKKHPKLKTFFKIIYKK